VAHPTVPDKSRHLTPTQEVAVALVLAGKTDGEAAEAAGVTRQTVWEWRHNHPTFIAEVNRRRKEVWGAAAERLRGLLGRAVEVLEEGLDAQDPRVRQRAASLVLQVLGLMEKRHWEPVGPTTPEEVEQEVERAAARRAAWDAWNAELDRLFYPPPSLPERASGSRSTG
jgi:HEAT repeat protein